MAKYIEMKSKVNESNISIIWNMANNMAINGICK